MTSGFVYLVVAATQSIRAFDGVRHLIIFAFMLLYLFTMHLFRVYHDYMGWTLDITGPLMLLTIKVRRGGRGVCWLSGGSSPITWQTPLRHRVHCQRADVARCRCMCPIATVRVVLRPVTCGVCALLQSCRA